METNVATQAKCILQYFGKFVLNILKYFSLLANELGTRFSQILCTIGLESSPSLKTSNATLMLTEGLKYELNENVRFHLAYRYRSNINTFFCSLFSC